MAKKCIEEFNPWPPFVDIFSSVILVMLLFLLVTLVNLGYYAQFKFKVTYSGSVTTDNLVLTNDVSKVKQVKRVEKVDTTKRHIQKLKDQAQEDQKIIQELKQEIFNVKEKTAETRSTANNLEMSGKKFYEQKDDNATTEQKIVQNEDQMIVTFKDSEIILDKSIIKEMKKFIIDVKKRVPNNKVYISAFDPENQVSFTIAKQISLARTLNVRNLIRKLNYKKSDVRINLLNPKSVKGDFSKKNGYIIINIRKHK